MLAYATSTRRKRSVRGRRTRIEVEDLFKHYDAVTEHRFGVGARPVV
jgi:hypothetical protein